MAILNEAQPKPGTEGGPSAILSSGLLTQLQTHFERIHLDSGKPNEAVIYKSLDPDYVGMKNPRAVSTATKHISEQVYEYSRSDSLVLTLSRYYSNAIGTLTGVSRALRGRFDSDVAMICVDAHVSINTPETSPSKKMYSAQGSENSVDA